MSSAWPSSRRTTPGRKTILAYTYRLAGSQRENLEQALACFTEALRVRTPAELPVDYAQTQRNLGLAYLRRLAGSRRENLEQAIACFAQALHVFTLADFPYEYADTQNRLGIAYAERLDGSRRANLEQAIACFREALQVFTLSDFAFHYARVQNNLGQAYRRRIEGERGTNIEQAIACYGEALRVWTVERMPSNHAMAQDSLGEAYLEQLSGDRRENVELAIACFHEVLRVYTLEGFPVQYAAAQARLGRAYQARAADERRSNLEQAAACYGEALRVFTLDDSPIEYRNTQLDLAWLAYDALVAQARRDPDPSALQALQALQAACRQAHQAFAAARQAQADLAWLESDAQGHAILQSMRPDLRMMYARDAWCLWQLDDLCGAVVALEAGRAHAMGEAQAIAGVSLDDVCAEHSTAFHAARQQWHEARTQDDRSTVRSARETFLVTRSTIRAHCQPDFLPSESSYQEIARAAAPDQALVYLAASDYGGMALVARPHAKDTDDRSPCCIALPRLTEQAVDTWLVRRDAEGHAVGGYHYAVRHNGAELLREWVFSARAEREQLPAVALRDLGPRIPAAMPTLRAAVEDVVAAWRTEADLLSGGTAAQQAKARELRTRLAMPVREALDDALFVNDLNWFLCEAELERLLDDLQETFVQDLRQALDALGLGDQDQPLALVPCGRLGVLPIHAAWVQYDTGRIPFQETCELTLQPSARALAHARRSADVLPAGGPVLTIGDPQPTTAPPLEWAEAEAEVITALARRGGRGESEAIIGDEATLSQVLHALDTIRHTRPGAWVHAACHGHADPADPANCYLLLAHDERLALERLHRQRLLDGIRGVSASGCVTGLGDFETAPDELSSFAAGVLQAGAPCAVAMLWSVSDRATFLLMLRFAQALLGEAGTPPARALRDAAHWMRTADQAQIEGCARRGPHPGRLSAMRPIQPEPEEHAAGAVRGVGSPADVTSMPLRSVREGMRMAPAGAFAMLAVPRASHRHLDRPYAHPIYWAAAVVYGL